MSPLNFLFYFLLNFHNINLIKIIYKYNFKKYIIYILYIYIYI